MQSDAIKNIKPYWQKTETKFWMLTSSKCRFCHCFGAQPY